MIHTNTLKLLGECFFSRILLFVNNTATCSKTAFHKNHGIRSRQLKQGKI